MLVDVTAAALAGVAPLLGSDGLRTRMSQVLPLGEALLAHRMLDGAPDKPGKIVLRVSS